MTISIAHLEDRSVIAITGEGTLDFLQDLITCDVADLVSGKAAHGGLLTPQGKILFDFFVFATDTGVLIDCQKSQADSLVQRLTMYKLRRPLELEKLDTMAVAAAWGDADLPDFQGGYVFQDPRHDELGYRVLAAENAIHAMRNETAEVYTQMRYQLGIADAAEIGSGEVFPHEACYDQFGSVDFKKGCYIGQEVVSRMQHRGTARSRIIKVSTDSDALPSEGSITNADDKPVGKVLSSIDTSGLALVRLDRAMKAGSLLSVDGQAVTLHKPSWAKWDNPDTAAESD